MAEPTVPESYPEDLVYHRRTRCRAFPNQEPAKRQAGEHDGAAEYERTVRSRAPALSPAGQLGLSLGASTQSANIGCAKRPLYTH